MGQEREKFATQMDSEMLAQLRELSKVEGRQIQALVEEAVAALLKSRKADERRSRIMELHDQSMARYGEVYRELAK